MNEYSVMYFNPSNIFLARDFYALRNNHGNITIGVEGGRGWRAYVTDTRQQLINGADVLAMCRWLNDNATEAKRIA